jgi:hypothetical protein
MTSLQKQQRPAARLAAERFSGVARAARRGQAGCRHAAGDSAPFFAYFLLYRSTLPAESTSFCRPVKNGWQAEQISIFRFPAVERVSNVFPQTHVTTDFL